MDKLLVNSRAARLHVLQPLTELHEFIDFVSDSSEWESNSKYEVSMASLFILFYFFTSVILSRSKMLCNKLFI